MQSPGEIVLFVLMAVLILSCMVVMYGHRLVAHRLVKDPDKRPQRSVDLAAFWPLLIIATAFPLGALWAPADGENAQTGRWMMTGFFALAVVWMLVVQRWNWYLQYGADTAFAVTRGSREHGETPEMYRAAFKRALPWATALVAVAFVIALIRVSLQI